MRPALIWHTPSLILGRAISRAISLGDLPVLAQAKQHVHGDGPFGGRPDRFQGVCAGDGDRARVAPRILAPSTPARMLLP
eukprot:6385829-Prymnesium_polylepis.1